MISFEYFYIPKYTGYMLSIDDYSTAKEIALLWEITDRMVIHYCDRGLIPDAVKKGNMWLIPTNANKPEDRRLKANRKGI